MAIRRFSSRTERLDKEFLAESLKGASKYFRIAGYFRSSIFELIGEEISKIPEVKIICNSELDLADFHVATGRNTALKERWNEVDIESEALLKKDRYQILDQLLQSGNVEIRIVPRERLFLHGKAGSIHYSNGSRKSFIGSVNESQSAFAHNYELVWQDDDEGSADWVEQEFWALWNDGVPLPEAILAEINRVANRREVTVEALKPDEVPAAAMAEAPIYRGGEQLQPWQRSFVTMFLKHREVYGKARLLLADEVGVGKTLSMATSALVSALLDDGPVLILAPSTLTIQWQIEMMDKLGIPAAVWSSQKKVWLGVEGQILSPRGDPSSIKKCPYRIAIISTGLIMHQREKADFVKEAGMLLKNRFGTVILDEAHKARAKGGLGDQASEPNNLMAFMQRIGRRTRHLILGTATPIQTDVRELWDLLGILNSGAEFVLGDALSQWHDYEQAIPLITGKTQVTSEAGIWTWLSNPLPPEGEHYIVQQIRDYLQIESKTFICSHHFKDLDYMIQHLWLSECLTPDFFKENNPVLRHTVLRKRKQLEDDGLLERVGVNTHPMMRNLGQYQSRFVGLGIPTNTPFQVAYEKAEEFSKLLQSRTRSAGFMKSLMLQRICSSFASGLKTAQKMLHHTLSHEDEDLVEDVEHILSEMTPAEVSCLREIETQLSRSEAVDSKLNTVKWFLTEFKTDGKSWLEHGCIIFSQYYDTAEWVAKELAKSFNGEIVAVYAGVGKSGLFRGEQFNNVERELIKSAIKTREIRLVVATDAACEGLNLQTLGTLINIDLPWNPSRLEQRLGRIKRFGQVRKFVDMLNLVYSETQDEKVYNVLSDRLRDTYDIFGSLPDTIDDDWIDDEEALNIRMNEYIHERKKAQDAFSIKYRASLEPDANLWERCASVLSRKDIINKLSEPWE
ncbi:phospholipase D-like domain-containing protein [Morganella morganii]|uniref:phospholipase D-like domain-containing anti-phage protein n=1 Tax=Morganella morganii TaxID=582 RepID=UPI0007DB8B06|nr:phospholipase D-like domain-containing anti-phage protein [Morganella morganii]HDS7362492.1 DEAD/DEAH box helicase family protein [Morganella morganii subsp. morganii]OAR98923.1 DEAD/DEAH box helicase [Morganella morganii]UEH04292.1 phospholipase D-like domain-containing protein [Morganella morganii]WNJ23728.1 phospholipase D-like domain-containing anti-phage protein [Morganella morganii]HEO9697127.1 DEAD/DEAH box helicase family protein [Morganella morganii subsp. morganii]